MWRRISRRHASRAWYMRTEDNWMFYGREREWERPDAPVPGLDAAITQVVRNGLYDINTQAARQRGVGRPTLDDAMAFIRQFPNELPPPNPWPAGPEAQFVVDDVQQAVQNVDDAREAMDNIRHRAGILPGGLRMRPRDIEEELGKDIKIEKLEGPMKSKLPSFKMPYENAEEAGRRLRGSLIVANGLPIYVESTYQVAGHAGGILMCVMPSRGDRVYTLYEDIDSLRPLPPMYLNLNQDHHGTYWCCRKPSTPHDRFAERDQHGDYMQGYTQRNGVTKAVGQTIEYRRNGAGPLEILASLKNKADFQFNPEFVRLIEGGVLSSLRLNDHVALYKVKDRLRIEYKGRDLGRLKDDRVVLSDEDKDTPWIYEDLRAAGLTC